MADLLVPADVEQAFIDELSAEFVIGTSIPDPMPAAFLRVNAAGGFNRNLVTDTHLVTLESFAKLETTASQNLVRAVGLIGHAWKQGTLGGVPFYRLEVNALPQNFPLPSVPSHKRYITTLAPDLRRRTLPL